MAPTSNGTHFTEPSGNTWTPAEIKAMLARQQLFRAHAFELACAPNDIEHRLTKPYHPWTTDVIDKSFLRGSAVSFWICGILLSRTGDRVAKSTGPEVQALPRSPYRRSSVAV